ncbi:MAG: trypsin-like peptidase domain-containing protein [Defluviitaleaceae bacterium]|nr:trypsin-like peptidase domain-containing protein [Defluviitaleaceae bacterium]
MSRNNEIGKTEKRGNEPEDFQPAYLPFAEAKQDDDEVESVGELTCSFDNIKERKETEAYAGITADAKPTGSPCGTAFYSETILSKKRNSGMSFFKPGRFAAVVAAFCIVGGVLIGVGVSILMSSDSNNISAQASRYVAAVAAHAENTGSVMEIQPLQPIHPIRIAPVDQPSFVSDYMVSALMVSNHIVELISHVEPAVAAISITGAAYDDTSDASTLRLPSAHDAERRTGGAGTGIIFAEDDERLYIVTNAHVIENARSVHVSVMDSYPVRARFIGIDVNEDIAVISIKKEEFEEANLTNWTLARFADSDQVQVGQTVIAIGNALGGGNTVTNGMISTGQQQIMVDGREYTVLQSTVSINPGNSGGPLINMDGEVIGINTARISRAYSVEGISYSITSNIAVPLITRIMNEISDRPFLGIEGRTVPREVAEMYGLLEIGVFVISVFNGSPAYIAGLERGDIITAINGELIMTMEALHYIITSHNIGDTVELRIIRDGTDFMYLPVVLERHIDTDF